MPRADEPTTDPRTRAAVAIELISVELVRSNPNWRTVRVLAARLLEIADRMDRGVEPGGGDQI
jgi:hypothetical protein